MECTFPLLHHQNKTYLHRIRSDAVSNRNLFCQMTANACKVPVITGPQEATVYGNLGMQLIAEQEVKDVKELRGLIRTSEDLKRYEPSDTEVWDEIYEIWKHTVKVREDNIL